jgi:hypothetical protein
MLTFSGRPLTAPSVNNCWRAVLVHAGSQRLRSDPSTDTLPVASRQYMRLPGPGLSAPSGRDHRGHGAMADHRQGPHADRGGLVHNGVTQDTELADQDPTP